MANRNDPHLRRAGDPGDHDAEREALWRELGMGAVRSPLPLDIDRVMHDEAGPMPDPQASAQALMDLVAHQKPPAATHFVDGALDEHARHEREAHQDDGATTDEGVG